MPTTVEEAREFLASGRLPSARPPKSVADTLKEFAFEAAEVPLGALATVGDVLSRPQLALSEAYGAYEGGEESPLAAGHRGLTEGFEGIEYPTFGERLVPEQEDEGYGRKLARLGAEMVTDPTILFAGPITKGIGKAGLAAGRIVKASGPARKFAQSDAAQTLSRLVMSGEYNLRKYGGIGGEFVADAGKFALKESDELIERDWQEFLGVLQETGLTNNSKAGVARRKLAANVLRGGGSSGDEGVDALAGYLRSKFQSLGDDVGNYVDDFGDRFMIHEAGGSRPFSVMENYYPQVFKDDFIQKALSKRGLSEQAEKLAKAQKISVQRAEEILRQHTGREKIAGHIELPQLPKSKELMKLLEDDPAVVFAKYIGQVHRRMSNAKQFGIGNQRLTEGIQKAADAGLSPKTAEEASNAILGRFTESALGLDNLAPKLMAFQVLTKMGPTSSLLNLTQQANPIVTEGITNYVRGLAKLATDEGVRQRSLEAFRIGMRSQLDQLVGGSSAPHFATRWLRMSGFTGVEKVNRMVSYAGGVASAEQMGLKAIRRSGGKIPENLKRILAAGNPRSKTVKAFVDSEWASFLKNGKFSPAAERRIGISAAEKTQFTSSWFDLPPMWRTPEMRLAMQFRSFIYQQSRFLVREVMQPAFKWADTGGAEGSIGPLARALAMYPIAGYGAAEIRELYAEGMANKLGIKRKFKRKKDNRQALMQMVSDSMNVGSLGMAGDMLEQASRGRIMDWAVGPTASGLAYGGEKLVGTARKMLFEGDFPGLEDVVEQGIRLVPGRRAVPLAPSELSQLVR
jgi:hypothetical protein